MINGEGLREREVECARIAAVLKAAVQGQGGLLLVQGPAGIGKSSLLAEARTQAMEAGVRVAVARASEMEQDFAFGVVRQLFEPLLTGPEGVRGDVWAGPAVQARPVFEPTGQSSGPAGDFAVLHGLYWLAANACQRRPLLLIVDDLQWCDIPSLRFLAYLRPRLDDLSLLVAAALRTGEPAADERLLTQLTDPAVPALQPGPLSERASTHLLAQAMDALVEEAFAIACHAASGGNPLLLHALAQTMTDEHLAPTAANAHRIAEVGPRAVSRLVATRLTRLPETARDLARAVAILGDRTELTIAAPLAGQDTITALESAAELEGMEILHIHVNEDGPRRLSFVHPLVRAATYHTLNAAARARGHQQAARLLAQAHADAERVAAHLLNNPPTGDPTTVDMLRKAADWAAARGSPDSAHTYLARALHEPLPAPLRLQVLTEAGQAALLTDVQAAAAHFHSAYTTAQQDADAATRAETAAQYASTLIYTGRLDECEQVLTDTITHIPADEQDLRRRLQAWLVIFAFNFPGQDRSRRHVAELHQLPADTSPGGRMLDCALALRETHLCDPRAVARARRGLAGGPLFELAGSFSNCAWWALTAADTDDVVDMINKSIDEVHQRGDLTTLLGIYYSRGRAQLQRGQLPDAETDLREGLRIMELTSLEAPQGFLAAWLAQSLMEQGRLDQAASVLDTSSSAYVLPYLLEARAQLLLLQGEHESALQTALTCRDICTVIEVTNPACISWRTWAALALHYLNRTPEARTIATEDLHLARQWGAPRALGRALRIAGLLHTDTTQRLDLLHQAVTTLQHSTARLEHAKALADYGAALRRAGQRTDARPPLRQALDLATQCGATPLVDFARAEVTAAGGRPRRTALTGPDALTPSERRTVDLAATGATNRQIAQQLHITPHTVEVHLRNAYRKLGITTRTQLSLFHPE